MVVSVVDCGKVWWCGMVWMWRFVVVFGGAWSGVLEKGERRGRGGGRTVGCDVFLFRTRRPPQ